MIYFVESMISWLVSTIHVTAELNQVHLRVEFDGFLDLI